ncbi:carboxymuconolactone decarboxylase family protein [Maricaulis sp.]|uniref:carboxymuconolactone decarboxylase family protein n=1 Tax=unclassified Maricaulis TaxID=2632371 RepID=UPI001B014880|nr:peroxidase-related enzyme [Maricaulis sp.]MBO6796991.1 peroxidase-related enzyme [Maricaulis sp.]
MSWIKTVSREAATGRLKSIYDRVAGPDGQIDNILASHSLRPHTLEGHMALYKATLHHFGNTLDKAYLETIGTYVSMLNKCAYCVEHHFAGLKRLLGDDARAAEIRSALESDDLASAFDGRDLAGLEYARELTRQPSALSGEVIERMRAAGFDDGEVLEINQVTAYFAYANRTVLGLGVSHVGEELGLSPNDSDSPDDWSHG